MIILDEFFFHSENLFIFFSRQFIKIIFIFTLSFNTILFIPICTRSTWIRTAASQIVNITESDRWVNQWKSIPKRYANQFFQQIFLSNNPTISIDYFSIKSSISIFCFKLISLSIFTGEWLWAFFLNYFRNEQFDPPSLLLHTLHKQLVISFIGIGIRNLSHYHTQ